MELGRGRGISRGRGFAPPTAAPKALRRPGNFGNVNQNNETSPKEPEKEDNFEQLRNLLTSLSSKNNVSNIPSATIDSVKALCDSAGAMNCVVNCTYEFSMKSKESAHFGALLCKSLGDLEVDGMKFRPLLLRKIQQDYEERKKNQENTDKFVISVVFLCEIFCNLRLPNGQCYDFLASPIVEYFNMLLDGKNDREIETFLELVKICYADLISCQPSAVEDLLMKMRRRIIEATLSVKARILMLETLELIITNRLPPNKDA